MYPTLILFISAALGSYTGLFYGPPFFFTIALAAIFAASSIVIRQEIIRALLIITATFLVCVSSASHLKTKHESLSMSIPSTPVIFEGIVKDLTRKLDDSIKGELAVTGIIDGKLRKAASLNLWFSLHRAAAIMDIHVGDRIRLLGHASRLPPALSPGEFDATLLGLARNIHGKISISDAFFVAVVNPAEEQNLFGAIRVSLAENLIRLTTPREAAVILALIVGDTSLFEQDQRDIYRLVGAGHLLAVSGLQISLLALILYRALLFLFLFLPKVGRLSYASRWASVCCLILLWCFVFISGTSASAVRAAAMASSLLIGNMLVHRVSPLDSLGIAGLATVLLSPACVIDPSFLLSYGAIIGLFVATSKSTIDLSFLKDNAEKPWRIRVDYIKTLFVSSLCASLITMPISAHLFGQISLAGILANIILIPLASIMQLPSIILGLLGAFLHNHILVEIAASCAGLIEALCEGIGEFIGGATYLPAPNGLISGALFFLVIIMLILFLQQRYILSFLSCGVAFALLSTPIWLAPNGLRVAFLPVGQGDSTIIEFPSGHTMLIDGGGTFDESLDTGERVVLPYLWRRGIKKIDVMVISHPDPDHILGLISVVKNMKVAQIWQSGFDESHPLMARMIALAHDREIPILNAKELWGEHSFGESVVQVLAPHPHNQDVMYPELGTNDNSLVLRIIHEGKTVLLPGDIEEWAEFLLLAEEFDLKSDLVKAPHHGSKTSSTDDFVESTRPSHVVFCTKSGNRWGFPHLQTVERWQASGANSWDTGRNGELLFWLSKNGIVARSFRG